MDNNGDLQRHLLENRTDGEIEAGQVPTVLPRQEEQEEPAAALFPLSREVLIKAAQPVATVAFVVTATSLVLAQQGLDPEKVNAHLLAAMNSILFSYIPVGLLGVLLSVAVKQEPRLVGVTSGFMLGHIVFACVMGGLVNVLKSGEDPRAAGTVSVVFVIVAVLIWAFVCSHPKYLRKWLRIERQA